MVRIIERGAANDQHDPRIHAARWSARLDVEVKSLLSDFWRRSKTVDGALSKQEFSRVYSRIATALYPKMDYKKLSSAISSKWEGIEKGMPRSTFCESLLQTADRWVVPKIPAYVEFLSKLLFAVFNAKTQGRKRRARSSKRPKSPETFAQLSTYRSAVRASAPSFVSTILQYQASSAFISQHTVTRPGWLGAHLKETGIERSAHHDKEQGPLLPPLALVVSAGSTMAVDKLGNEAPDDVKLLLLKNSEASHDNLKIGEDKSGDEMGFLEGENWSRKTSVNTSGHGSLVSISVRLPSSKPSTPSTQKKPAGGTKPTKPVPAWPHHFQRTMQQSQPAQVELAGALKGAVHAATAASAAATALAVSLRALKASSPSETLDGSPEPVLTETNRGNDNVSSNQVDQSIETNKSSSLGQGAAIKANLDVPDVRAFNTQVLQKPQEPKKPESDLSQYYHHSISFPTPRPKPPPSPPPPASFRRSILAPCSPPQDPNIVQEAKSRLSSNKKGGRGNARRPQWWSEVEVQNIVDQVRAILKASMSRSPFSLQKGPLANEEQVDEEGSVHDGAPDLVSASRLSQRSKTPSTSKRNSRHNFDLVRAIAAIIAANASLLEDSSNLFPIVENLLQPILASESKNLKTEEERIHGGEEDWQVGTTGGQVDQTFLTGCTTFPEVTNSSSLETSPLQPTPLFPFRSSQIVSSPISPTFTTQEVRTQRGNRDANHGTMKRADLLTAILLQVKDDEEARNPHLPPSPRLLMHRQYLRSLNKAKNQRPKSVPRSWLLQTQVRSQNLSPRRVNPARPQGSRTARSYVSPREKNLFAGSAQAGRQRQARTRQRHLGFDCR